MFWGCLSGLVYNKRTDDIAFSFNTILMFYLIQPDFSILKYLIRIRCSCTCNLGLSFITLCHAFSQLRGPQSWVPNCSNKAWNYCHAEADNDNRYCERSHLHDMDALHSESIGDWSVASNIASQLIRSACSCKELCTSKFAEWRTMMKPCVLKESVVSLRICGTQTSITSRSCSYQLL